MKTRLGVKRRGGRGGFGPRLIVWLGFAALLAFPAIAAAQNPTATTRPATNVTPESATLNGTANTEGDSGVGCFFEWGTDRTNLANTQPCDQGAALPAATTPEDVSLALVGAQPGFPNPLSPNTTYFYRLHLTLATGQPVDGNLLQFTTPPAPQLTTGPATNITQTSATLTGTVNPEGNTNVSCFFQWEATDSSLDAANQTPCDQTMVSGTSPVPVSLTISGLTPGLTYYYDVVVVINNTSRNPDGFFAEDPPAEPSFRWPPPPPGVVTGKPSSVSPAGGTLNATVNPNGGAVTLCQFNWGATSSYGHSAPCNQSVGSGASPVPVTASLGGLTPNTTYHFQIVSANAGGTNAGRDQTLTTAAVPPTVATGSPDSISPTGATLNGTVNPNASTVTTCRFDWGTTSSYGNSVPCAQQAGSGDTPVPVSTSLSGLNPNTTYHYRIVSANGAGTSNGLDQTVTTSALPPPTAGRNVNISLVSGTVLVKLPGSRNFILVGGLEQIPLGTIVDATRGVVTVFAAKKSHGQIVTGQVWGGLFRITQKRVSGSWLTVLKLVGPALTGCKARGAEIARARRPRHRAVWIRDPGYFMTVGKYATATDHGTTTWLTEDNCTGTLIKVRRGSVKVKDLPHHRTFTLKAGHSVTAHPGRGG